MLRLDVQAGRLEALVDEGEWSWRTAVEPDLSGATWGLGRELFANFRAQVTSAELGAAAIAFLPEPQALTRAQADAQF
jgi:phosphogluconate dehydratase